MASACLGCNLLRLQQLPQRHAVHEFHQQVVKPVRLAEIVHGDDVRVAQPRQRLGFAQEALGELRVGALLRREDLQRDEPVQLRLARLIDHAHAAAPEAFQDFQLRKVPGDFGRRRRRLDHLRAVRAGFAGCFGVRGQAHAQHAARAKPLRGVGRQGAPQRGQLPGACGRLRAG